jgi:hypothetical protein
MKFVVHRFSSQGPCTIKGQPTGTVLNKGYFVPWHHFRFNLLDIQLELVLHRSTFVLNGTELIFTLNQSMCLSETRPVLTY